MNFQRHDLPVLQHKAEIERDGAARKVAGEFGLEDSLSASLKHVKRRDGVVVLFFVSAFHSLMASNPGRCDSHREPLALEAKHSDSISTSPEFSIFT